MFLTCSCCSACYPTSCLDSSLNRNLEWLTFFNFFFVTKCAITLLATRIVSCFFQKGSLQSSCQPSAQINTHLILVRHLSHFILFFVVIVTLILIDTQIVSESFQKGSLQSSYQPPAQIILQLTLVRHLLQFILFFVTIRPENTYCHDKREGYKPFVAKNNIFF